MRGLDIPGTAERKTAFLKKTVIDAGFSRLVAVSGDVDSGTPVALAAAALGPEAVFCPLAALADLRPSQ
jgi:NH3-dependent NAD+ synthetase